MLGDYDVACRGHRAATSAWSPTPRSDALSRFQGVRFKNYNCRGPVHAVLRSVDPDRPAAASALGKCSVPSAEPARLRARALGSTLERTLRRCRVRHRGFASGDVADRGAERLCRRIGIDEQALGRSGYSSYPLFAESGVRRPKIWEGWPDGHPGRTSTWRRGRSSTSRSRHAAADFDPAERRSRHAVLHLRLLHPDAPAPDPPSGRLSPGASASGIYSGYPGRVGPPYRSGAGRHRPGRDRLEHHRRLEPRQPGGPIDLDRTAPTDRGAAISGSGIRGRHARAGDGPLAWRGASRRAHD